MKRPLVHQTTQKFWQLYNELPADVREMSGRNYELLKSDPKHPSFLFKNIERNRLSVRVGLHYRALALETDMVFTWIWIGPHAEYDRLIG